MSKLAVLGSALSFAAGCVASDDDIIEDGIVEVGIIEQAATASASASYTDTRIARVVRSGLVIEEGRLLPPSGDIAGFLLAAKLDDGRSVRLRIESEELLPAGGVDLPAYRVRYTFDGVEWGTICGGPDNLAVVIDGGWDTRIGVPGAGGPLDDPDHFMFACREAPLATCAELGYAPWRIDGAIDLRDHHAACVRMLRGDFCGDGTAWRDTATLEVADRIRINDAEYGWSFDATWSARGATCVAAPSSPSTIAGPACFASLTDCVPALDDSSLLVSTSRPSRESRPTATSSIRGGSRSLPTP